MSRVDELSLTDASGTMSERTPSNLLQEAVTGE